MFTFEGRSGLTFDPMGQGFTFQSEKGENVLRALMGGMSSQELWKVLSEDCDVDPKVVEGDLNEFLSILKRFRSFTD